MSCARGKRVIVSGVDLDVPVTGSVTVDGATCRMRSRDRARLIAVRGALDTLHSTVVAAIHDLDLVLRHFDATAVVDDGRIVAYGPPAGE